MTPKMPIRGRAGAAVRAYMIGSFPFSGLLDLCSFPYSYGSYTGLARRGFPPPLAIALLLAALLIVLCRVRLVLETLRVSELHVRLEASEIGLDGALHEPEARRHLLDHPLRDEVHRDHDTRETLVQLVERHDPRVRHPGGGLPGDAAVLAPGGDLALPGTLAEPDLLVPRDLPVFLLHVQEAVHELRELLELRPLLVGLVDRCGNVGPALDRQPAGLLRTARAASAADDLRRELADSAGARQALLRALGPV